MSRSDIASDIGVFWDHYDLAIAGSFTPIMVNFNLKASLAKKNMCGFFELYYYADKLPVPDYLVQHYEVARFHFMTSVVGGNSTEAKFARTKVMIRDILLWALDMRRDCNVEPANLVVVSNNISPEPEFVALLQALAKKKNFKVLLVQSGKNMYVKKVDIPTESFDWLWESIIGGGNHMQDVEFESSKTEAAAEETITEEYDPRWIIGEEEALAILETEEAFAKLAIDIEKEEEAAAKQERKEESVAKQEAKEEEARKKKMRKKARKKAAKKAKEESKRKHWLRWGRGQESGSSHTI